jgi:hypothetical protein
LVDTSRGISARRCRFMVEVFVFDTKWDGGRDTATTRYFLSEKLKQLNIYTSIQISRTPDWLTIRRHWIVLSRIYTQGGYAE